MIMLSRYPRQVNYTRMSNMLFIVYSVYAYSHTDVITRNCFLCNNYTFARVSIPLAAYLSSGIRQVRTYNNKKPYKKLLHIRGRFSSVNKLWVVNEYGDLNGQPIHVTLLKTNKQIM